MKIHNMLKVYLYSTDMALAQPQSIPVHGTKWNGSRTLTTIPFDSYYGLEVQDHPLFCTYSYRLETQKITLFPTAFYSPETLKPKLTFTSSYGLEMQGALPIFTSSYGLDM